VLDAVALVKSGLQDSGLRRTDRPQSDVPRSAADALTVTLNLGDG
jgi:hypothetical protein